MTMVLNGNGITLRQVERMAAIYQLDACSWMGAKYKLFHYIVKEYTHTNSSGFLLFFFGLCHFSILDMEAKILFITECLIRIMRW